MSLEGQERPVPRERTFAELFPWRSLRRAFMLVVLIVGIVIIKQSMARLLGTATQLWGPLAPEMKPASGRVSGHGFGVHLAPSLGSTGEPKAPPSKQ